MAAMASAGSNPTDTIVRNNKSAATSDGLLVISDDDDPTYNPDVKSKGKKVTPSKPRKRKQPKWPKMVVLEVPAPEESSPICFVHQDTVGCSMIPTMIYETPYRTVLSNVTRHRCGIGSFVCTEAAAMIVEMSNNNEFTCVVCRKGKDDNIFLGGPDPHMAAALQLLPYPCPYDCKGFFLLKNLKTHQKQCDKGPCPNTWEFRGQQFGCGRRPRTRHDCEYQVAKKADGSVDPAVLMQFLHKLASKLPFSSEASDFVFKVIGADVISR
eukprot:jgi/Mesvir1/19792/Mv13084-RA.1